MTLFAVYVKAASLSIGLPVPTLLAPGHIYVKQRNRLFVDLFTLVLCLLLQTDSYYINILLHRLRLNIFLFFLLTLLGVSVV